MEEKILIPNGLKENIAAVIHRPKSPTAKLAILTPGYLDTKDYPHLVHLASSLAENGYTAVRYDPTGIWESQTSTQDYTVGRQLTDIRTILDYMLRRNSYNRVLLGGHSRGGLVSIVYAAQDKRISGILAIMSPSAIINAFNKDKAREWKESGFRISRRDIPGTTSEKEFQVPYTDLENSQKYDALEGVRKLHVPIFLVAGELDTVVPSADVRLVFDNANDPKYFLLLKNIKHDYRYNPEDIKEVDSKIVTLLGRTTGF